MGKGKELVSNKGLHHDFLDTKVRVLFTGFSGIPDDYVLFAECFNIYLTPCNHSDGSFEWALSVGLSVGYGNASANFCVILGSDVSRDFMKRSYDSLLGQLVKGEVPVIHLDIHDFYFNYDLVDYVGLRCAAEKFVDEQLDRHPSDIMII